MTWRILACLALAMLAACAAESPPPAEPRPECALPTDQQPEKDGGLGGTGNAAEG